MVGEDEAGGIMLEMIIGAGCNSFHGVSKERILDPTLIEGTAENVIPEKLFKLPDAVFFDIFIFPDAAADQRFGFHRTGHGAEEEAVPSTLGGFAIFIKVDDTGQRHQDMQKLAGGFFHAVGSIVVGKIETVSDRFPPFKTAGIIDLQLNVRAAGKQFDDFVFLPVFEVKTIRPL